MDNRISQKSEKSKVSVWERIIEFKLTDKRPIAALIAGISAKDGKIMGHAGAWQGLGEPNAQTKIDLLEKAGVHMVNHPSEFGKVMSLLIQGNPHPV
jgi:succinyl-CoA synthetase alpha subunit